MEERDGTTISLTTQKVATTTQLHKEHRKKKKDRTKRKNKATAP